MNVYLDIVHEGMNRAPQVLHSIVWVVNTCLVVLFCFLHQSGVYKAAHYLESNVQDSDPILFLAPCHSFPTLPFYSNYYMLSCDPPHVQEIEEQDEFYNNPVNYGSHLVKKIDPLYIVHFEALDLTFQNYSLDTSFYNGFFHDDERRLGRIIIIKKFQ